MIHGDVKAANVLLGNGGVAKISGLWPRPRRRNGGLHTHVVVTWGNCGLHGSRAGRGGRFDRDGGLGGRLRRGGLLAEVLTGDEPFADASNDVAIALRVRDGRAAGPAEVDAGGCARR